MVELLNIQQELKAPKDKYNKFGGFPYRNASGILEAVKPLLKKYKCIITLHDEIALLGDRFYIHSVVTLVNESGDKVEADGWAREQENKAGMDAAQLTGACSSYARKYALCGLFAIDDSELDPDTMDNREPEVQADSKTEAQQKPIVQNKEKESLHEASEKWEQAIQWCIEKNAQPALLRKWYQISEEDEIKLRNAISVRKLSAGDPNKEKDIIEFQKEFGTEIKSKV